MSTFFEQAKKDREELRDILSQYLVKSEKKDQEFPARWGKEARVDDNPLKKIAKTEAAEEAGRCRSKDSGYDRTTELTDEGIGNESSKARPLKLSITDAASSLTSPSTTTTI